MIECSGSLFKAPKAQTKKYTGNLVTSPLLATSICSIVKLFPLDTLDVDVTEPVRTVEMLPGRLGNFVARIDGRPCLMR